MEKHSGNCMCAQSCLTPLQPHRLLAARLLCPRDFQHKKKKKKRSGLPLSSPRDLPDPGFEPVPLESPALAGRLFTTGPPGKLHSGN